MHCTYVATSGLEAAVLDFQLPVSQHCVGIVYFEMFYTKMINYLLEIRFFVMSESRDIETCCFMSTIWIFSFYFRYSVLGLARVKSWSFKIGG